jgi:hypothetical protein
MRYLRLFTNTSGAFYIHAFIYLCVTSASLYFILGLIGSLIRSTFIVKDGGFAGIGLFAIVIISVAITGVIQTVSILYLYPLYKKSFTATTLAVLTGPVLWGSFIFMLVNNIVYFLYWSSEIIGLYVLSITIVFLIHVIDYWDIRKKVFANNVQNVPNTPSNTTS